ncbi:MAG TPA: lactate utilization protein [Pelovirga sp.]|nr:lactate utilization protein [Pelovirga sp.]
MCCDRINQCRAALIANGFKVFIAKDRPQARNIFFDKIFPSHKTEVISWADSMTMEATGVLADLLVDPSLNMIKTFDPDAAGSEVMKRRRQALLADLFLTGTNAVTLCGKLVNLDMIGNRTGAISFGPKKVVLFVGRNKIVDTLEDAFDRIRNHAAPLNAKRHNMATPCAETGRCHDCRSPQRICNTWSILDKCFPPERISIVLIDEDLGL